MRTCRCDKGYWGFGLYKSPCGWSLSFGPWVITTDPWAE